MIPEEGKYLDRMYDIPFSFLIDTGNLCNLRCPYCPTGALEPGSKRGMMELDTFKIVLERIEPWARHLEMMNWGEPFLNRDLVTMVRLAADKGICVNFDSNLCTKPFTESQAEDIVRSGVYSIKASIDGTTQETYELYRKTGNYSVAMANLKLIQTTKIKLGSKTPNVGWQFLVHAENEHQIDTAKAMAKEMGIFVCFRPLTILDNKLHPSNMHKNPYVQEDWDFRYNLEFEEALGDALTYKFLKLRDMRPLWSPKLPAGVSPVCVQPFNRVVINFDGQVVPCCNCYGDEFNLGDLKTERLEDIWNGQGLRASREFLLNYGEKQFTGSVCESHYCPPMPKKHLMDPAVSLPFTREGAKAASQLPLYRPATKVLWAEIKKLCSVSAYVLRKYLTLFYDRKAVSDFFVNVYAFSLREKSQRLP